MADPALRIIGIPMDLGQTRRGVDMGPSAVRYAGLQERLQRLGYDVHDCGNVAVPQPEQIEAPFDSDKSIGRAHNLPQVAEVCQSIFDYAGFCIRPGDRALFIGGDHSLSIATISCMTRREPVGVIWVDAHADINTPHTTPSGNIHGMCVAALLGDGPPALTDVGYAGPKLKPGQLAYVALRDLDPPERERLAHGHSLAYTMREIDQEGIGHISGRVLERLAAYQHIHVSLDMDGIDPSAAPGVGTPVPGGLTVREAHLLMEVLADSGKVRSMDIVEINPILDHQNQTAVLAASLAASLFGARIL
jgi:arginase